MPLRFLSLALPFLGATLLLVLPAPGGDAPKKNVRNKNAEPRTVTIKEDKIPLSKALDELDRQADLEVEDRREVKVDTELKLNLTKATFWQALDTIAREVDCRVSMTEMDGRLALVDGPFKEQHACYSGVFRMAVKRIVVDQDLDSDAHTCVATLEIAWEPGFRPFFVEPRSDSIEVEDDKGEKLETMDGGGGQVSEDNKIFSRVELRFKAPPRRSPKLGLFKGTLAVVGSNKGLTFRFPTLGEIKKNPKVGRLTQDGMTVRISPSGLDEGAWTLDASLEYPEAGPKFESFEIGSLVVYNEMYLESRDGKTRFPNNGGYQTGGASDTRVNVSYNFLEERRKDLILGKPEDWRVVYETPGPMIEVPANFEFKDVPLP